MIYRMKDAKTVLDADKAIGKLLAMTESKDYVHLVLQAGGEVAPHVMPIKVTFFVIEGNGVIGVAGIEENLEAGDMIEVDANLERGWRNSSDSILKLLVIKDKP